MVIARSRRGSENRRRQQRIAARMDEAEHDQVEQAARRTGVSVATFVRDAVIAAAVHLGELGR
jgi:uncharacterized protein (DUF1778 family)